MAGFQSVVPAVVGGAVNYASSQADARQARADRAAQLEAARQQRAWERQQAREEQAHQRRMEQEAFERELALERARTQRAREIYEAELPAFEADPGLVRERLDTLEARAEARETRAQELAAAQASARASAASAGITGGGTAKAIQRNLIDRSQASGAHDETRYQIRLDAQDKRHAQNLLEAENRRRRAMLGLEMQLEPRA
ncbi:hypothetical protein [Rhodovibrio salinarum]|uniref:Uncharacterized protein n=1 Tax=Rhodovibrio salinarum TaxID=1087 RepID=A0A934QLQ1_9PROT|nr:hypothetical protein [Rhodovibrio salinarum]MBK1699247.1 hypothetical protein [Rhodovibrio salinarum]